MAGIIDLSQLPAPEIVQTPTFDELLEAIKQDFLARHPGAADVIDLESEPVTKLLEAAAYFSLIQRQKFKDGAKSLLLAYAEKDALDHIGVTYYDTERLQIRAADPDATPPVTEIMESDSDYKRRIQLAMDSPSTAGSENGYRYHALSAHEDVMDATAINRYAGIVRVTVLSRLGSGEAAPTLVDTVKDALSAERARPLNDQVEVRSAEVIRYSVLADLQLRNGPDPEVVRLAAAQAAQRYADERHALGENIVKDALAATMYVQGVERVTLSQPTADISCDDTQAPYCESVEVSVDE